MNSCAKFGRFFNGATSTLLKRNLKRFQHSPTYYRMSTSASISEYKREMETFQDVYPTVIEAVSKNYGLVQNPEVTTWLKRVLEYNLRGGKKARGLSTIFAYETLERPENITEESLRLIRILGWCVEMLQAYFLIMDDIMDSSSTRRGYPCWYRLPDVGMGAVNDCNLVQSAMYEILKVYCGKLPTYKDIVHLFNETLFNTAIGQHLDFTMGNRTKSDYSLFTRERYAAIVKYKTAYYTFKLPVFLGMLLMNNMTQDTFDRAEKICLDLGHLFQMQDDFLDCYSPEHILGKKGTDIQEGKCSWLAVEALQRLTAAQRKVFTTCYGSHEPAHIERIKRLYEELELPQHYRAEERQRYDAILKMTQQLPADSGAMPELFLKLLAMLNERKK
ncbi:farnesyl pyrophosphate synthase 2 isoform X2 [Zerene cesonia]|uniref:farnesyl pyrophosphate synthase 2 isoform X2 n=1 Tax=Zerene cesonia TaxID=33412 RepID=UPI0018E51228|nr:farnesyl pyrophosphate synthase 2 isoform X2 [Zerene cesonia]XP_038211601.1 farnesyl pyrophosphate synthase 2 isoform X2 [Zerene cesonia]